MIDLVLKETLALRQAESDLADRKHEALKLACLQGPEALQTLRNETYEHSRTELSDSRNAVKDARARLLKAFLGQVDQDSPVGTPSTG